MFQRSEGESIFCVFMTDQKQISDPHFFTISVVFLLSLSLAHLPKHLDVLK